MKWILSLVLLLQGVKMTEDFLPLTAGNHWVYDVSNEAGQKIGQVEFSVNDRRIVSGRSVYAVSGLPFLPELAAPGMIGYDRETRQFVRISGGDAIPLFSGDAESTEVLQSDASGVPQKFALHAASATLIFQRGVGIIEARFDAGDGPRIAKIASSDLGGNAAKPPAAAPAAPAAGTGASAASPTSGAAAAVSSVGEVTAENPVLSVSFEDSRDGPAGIQGLKLELLVVNTSNKLLPFKFSSSKSYDFVISNPVTGEEVWRWSHEKMFAQVIRADSIRANGKWTFSEVWNRRDNDRNALAPGRYRLVGILSSQPPIESDPIMIDVP
jgi:hypothetical protein